MKNLLGRSNPGSVSSSKTGASRIQPRTTKKYKQVRLVLPRPVILAAYKLAVLRTGLILQGEVVRAGPARTIW